MESFDVGLLNAKDAYELDQLLFSSGYTLEQLMELAGLAVAEVIFDVVPNNTSEQNILVIAGPGNNGGDGYVIGRHLQALDREVEIVSLSNQERLNLIASKD